MLKCDMSLDEERKKGDILDDAEAEEWAVNSSSDPFIIS